MIKSRRVLVTGGGGSIGSELVRQLAPHNKIFVIDINAGALHGLMSELKIYGRVGDIRDKEVVHDVFSDFKPQIVFHAAANKYVDLCEKYPSECIETNVIGTRNLIEEAKKWECVEKFVFISTDKVNGGSLMGATKKLGEIMAKNVGYHVVRFANVLGSSGSVIPIWEKQINSGGAVTVTSPEMERYFMTIQEAVNLVIQAAETFEGGKIITLDMGDPVKILDLAKKIIEASRKKVEIEITGIRPGEQLREKLMSEEEEKVAIKKGKFFVINGS